jgi:ferredoxin--NADP+ reductase
MLRTQLVCGGPRRFAVLHGARHSWDLGYRSELVTLERNCSNFTYTATVSRPGQEPVPWRGHVGYVQDLWRSKPLGDTWGGSPTPEDTHVLLCGNPQMVDSMLEALGEEGFREHTRKKPGQVHVERYW